MNFGALIIGDEILSGKRQDKHFAKVAELLGARGLQLSWVQYLGDDRARLTEPLKRSVASGEAVFSFGGIGEALALSFRGRDYAVLQVLIMASAAIFVLVNLVVDILYAVIDPRVRTR